MNLITFKQFDQKRKERELSISELCRRADVNRLTYHRWKNGNMLSTRILAKLLKAVR